ncbi:hypothetical protein EAI_02572 [Harpegnathos saltator]|uniref:Uncharacterized protein n=1 Tax=Harpegnathos saltator TaxID=610380 RepID=E2B5A7_HARSA|nr:hypothetical protein EAI_02572 [Harpegnathos saltator]
MADTKFNANAEFKKIAYGDSEKTRYESYMLLSTTYPLNTSDTKRKQIGLWASNDWTTFEPTIKLSGNTSTGIQFDFATWEKFKQYMKHIGDYLHSVTRAMPEPVHINDVTITFTAHGARAIMVTENTKTAKVNTASKRMPTDSSQGQQPPTKKRKVYTVNIVDVYRVDEGNIFRRARTYNKMY